MFQHAWQWLTPDKIVAVATVVYAFVTVVMFVEIRRQTEATRRQAEIAEIAAKAAKQSAEISERSATFAQQALKACERADILLESAGIVYPPHNDPGDAWLVLKFKNFGRTRAKDVSFKANMIIAETPSSSSPALPLPVVTMASGQEQSVRFQTFREFLTRPTFERIRKGDLPLRFESWVVYKDAFGDVFTTRDVGVLDPKTFTFKIEEQNAG